MRAAKLVWVGLAAFAVGGSALLVGSDDLRATAPIPRVCWFSDYANAKLSNRCSYRTDEERWYMLVDGVQVPADTQRLKTANLCLYFSGSACPD